IAVTGGPSSGKSTVAAAFERRGWAVLSADEEAHKAIEPGTEGYARIVSFLGSRVVAPDGRLDRAAVADYVFDPSSAYLRPDGRVASDLLTELEVIVHPVVREALLQRTAKLRASGASGVVWEVPLLFESGFECDVDDVVVVAVSEGVMLKRLMDKGLTGGEAMSRIRAQIPIAQKAELADHLLPGDLPPEELDKAVAAIIRGEK
ncbi:MAG TPA: dephospho-CoA kinase, partial [Alphaproteobacteria bacterium]|nr:dephospho-CoA kinase [Alphaproteobacteria bacterium]